MTPIDPFSRPRPRPVETSRTAKGRVLVVGFGNTLRGDDAAGVVVAESIEALRPDGVVVEVCHQLTPEMSERVAGVERVIFVDASETNERPAEVREIVGSNEAPLLGHAVDPRGILALAKRLFGRCPRAWLVTVAACSFELGADPSGDCVRGMAQALEAVRELCEAADDE